MLVLKGWERAVPIGWLRLPGPLMTSQENRGRPPFIRATAAPPTAVTHLTITSLKVNWLLFQQDDNAN